MSTPASTIATTPKSTTIDLLRHGQTTVDDILRGRIDVPLSTQGYQQMLDRLDDYIAAGFPWQQLITSPLQRCAKFAQDLSEQHGSPIAIDHGFLEMDFGDWDGRRFDELRAENPELFTRVWREPHNYSPPNGESFEAFRGRVTAAWNQMVERHRGQHVLLICHGGVIRALIATLMQTPLTTMSRIDVPYACLSRVRVHHQSGEELWPELVFHNRP